MRRIVLSRIHGLFLWLAVVVVTAGLAFGQVTGSLTGTVVDSQGGALSGAKVSLLRPGGTEPVLQTLTSGEGVFVFSTISPESYTLTVDKDGFGPLKYSDVKVSPGVELALRNLAMTPGVVKESVESVANVVSVQSTTSQVSTTLTVEQLDGLPVLGRNTFGSLGLVATQAGVSDNGRSQPTIDGLRVSLNDITYDGVNVQDNFVRSNGLSFVTNRPYLSAVSEFTLVTSNGTALFGGGTTHVVAASPSGTNSYRGSVYGLNSYRGLDANDWFNNKAGVKTSPLRNQAGATFGGPIKRDKLLFFLNYELVRVRNGTQTTRFVLSPSARAGSGSTVDPVAAAVINRIPLPNILSDPTGTGLFGQYQFMYTTRVDRDNVLAKIDYLASSKNALTASYFWNRDYNDLGVVLFSPTKPEYQDDSRNFFSGSWRYSPAPSLTNELRGGLNRSPSSFFNRDFSGSYLVQFPNSIGGLNPFDLNSPQGRTTTTYHVEDNGTYTRGKHRLQFGVQANWIRVAASRDNYPIPVLQLASDARRRLAVDVQTLLTGKLSGSTLTFGLTGPNSNYLPSTIQRNAYEYDNVALYVQDSWKVARGLVLTLGLRYEYLPPVKETTGIYFQPVIQGSLYSTLINPGQFQIGSPSQLYRPTRAGFGPNIGLAWDPMGRGKTVFRAAYGRSYVNDDIINRVDQALRDTGGVSLDWTTFGGTLSSPPKNLGPTRPSSYVYQSDGSSLLDSPSVPDPGLRPPTVQQWSAGIQQEFRSNLFDVRYVGNHAQGLLREVNLLNSAADGVLLGNFSASSYNALQADVSRRFRTGLRGQANYTFSKVLSDSFSGGGAGFDPYRDVTNTRLDRARAAFDITHAFKANFICDLPDCVYKPSRVPIPRLFGGWTLSGIMIWQSGGPFGILSGQSAPNIFSFNSASGTNTANPTVSPDQLASALRFSINGNGPTIVSNPAAFADPAKGKVGFLQYRRFTGPSSFDLNLGLAKRFRITERQTVQFRFEAINALNHPTFVVPSQYVGSATFGSDGIGTLNPPRTVQLSLYYKF